MAKNIYKICFTCPKIGGVVLYTPTRLVFGSGLPNELHKQSFTGRKGMIAISNGKSTLRNGALARTRKQLALAGVETVLFDKVQANPLKDTVVEGAACAPVKDTVPENGCDFIVALGGGSVLDASKGIASVVLRVYFQHWLWLILNS